IDAHTGGGCACALVQSTDGYGPQSLATMPPQPLSSSTVVVPHSFAALHAPSTRVPWHVPVVTHTGGLSYALQSLSAAQQSPAPRPPRSSSPFSAVPPSWSAQLATSASPSQADGDVHAGAREYDDGQSCATPQQSPAPQQKPFWQWPLLQRRSSVPHESPSSR